MARSWEDGCLGWRYFIPPLWADRACRAVQGPGVSYGVDSTSFWSPQSPTVGALENEVTPGW